MPSPATLPKKIINLNYYTKLVLTILNEVFAQFKITQANQTKEELRPGLWKLIKLAEMVAGFELGADQITLNPESDLSLDPPAAALLQHYIHELNIQVRNDNITSEATENEVISNHIVLIREILLRWVKIALSIRLDITQNGENIIAALDEFVNRVNKNQNLKTPHLSVFFATTHPIWISSLKNMASIIRDLHANTTGTSEALRFLHATKRVILCQIVAYLDSDTIPSNFSQDHIYTTFLEGQQKFLTTYRPDSFLTVTPLTPAINDIETHIYDASSTDTAFIQEILAKFKEKFKKENEKIKKLEKLYNFLTKTNLYLQITNQLDLMMTTSSWVPILTGALETENFARLLKEHGKEGTEVLFISPDDPLFILQSPAGEGLKMYQAANGVNLETGSKLAGWAMYRISDADLINRLKQYMSGSFSKLLQLEKKLGNDCQLINRKVIDYFSFSTMQPSLEYKSNEFGLSLSEFKGMLQQVDNFPEELIAQIAGKISEAYHSGEMSNFFSKDPEFLTQAGSLIGEYHNKRDSIYNKLPNYQQTADDHVKNYAIYKYSTDGTKASLKTECLNFINYKQTYSSQLEECFKDSKLIRNFLNVILDEMSTFQKKLPWISKLIKIYTEKRYNTGSRAMALPSNKNSSSSSPPPTSHNSALIPINGVNIGAPLFASKHVESVSVIRKVKKNIFAVGYGKITGKESNSQTLINSVSCILKNIWYYSSPEQITDHVQVCQISEEVASTGTGYRCFFTKSAIRAIIVDKNNNFLISASTTGNISISNLKTRIKLCDLIGHNNSVRALEILSSGHLMSGSLDNTVKIWDLKNKRRLHDLPQEAAVYAIKQISDNYIIVGGNGNNATKGTLWALDANSFSLKQSLPKMHTTEIINIISINESLFATSSRDNDICIWRTANLSYVDKISFNGCIRAITSYKGRYLLAGGDSKSINIWDIDNNCKYMGKLDQLNSYKSEITSLEIIDEELLVGLYNGNIHRFSMEDLNLIPNTDYSSLSPGVA